MFSAGSVGSGTSIDGTTAGIGSVLDDGCTSDGITGIAVVVASSNTNVGTTSVPSVDLAFRGVSGGSNLTGGSSVPSEVASVSDPDEPDSNRVPGLGGGLGDEAAVFAGLLGSTTSLEVVSIRSTRRARLRRGEAGELPLRPLVSVMS